jgi:hypothetical protein
MANIEEKSLQLADHNVKIEGKTKKVMKELADETAFRKNITSCVIPRMTRHFQGWRSRGGRRSRTCCRSSRVHRSALRNSRI